MIEEAKKQGKPYGLYFEDISSGFAVTTRSAPQAFQVIPLVVYRVYVDGRPDELVRGVSIVGTPLAAMKRIVSTSDKSEVFNGECGAESGTVPVSAVAPAMLVSEIETQRQQQGTQRPPILPIPGAPATRIDEGGTMKRTRRIGNLVAAGLLSAAILVPHGAPAQTTRADAEKDPVLKAMLDELDRSMAHLQLPGFEKPYFIEYRIEDVRRLRNPRQPTEPAEGSQHSHARIARISVRVGDYKTDNSGPRGDGALQTHQHRRRSYRPALLSMDRHRPGL